MKSRIVTVVSVAVAMALPVGGALAQTGTFSSDARPDAAAQVDATVDGPAEVTLGANASANAQAAIDATPPRRPAPEPQRPQPLPPEPAPTDAPVDAAPPSDVAPVDPPVTDEAPPRERPTTDTRPVDRPEDRPITDRPEREPRHETFRVGEAGAVTVWWTPRGFTDLEVRTHEGWRYHAERADHGRTLRVAFWSGTHGYLFTAHITDDGSLRTHVEKRERDAETRTERFEVADVGVVAVTWNVRGIHEVEAKAIEGWRHRIHRVDRRTVHVGFTNGEKAYVFTAHVTEDGALRTNVTERDVTTDERPTDERPAQPDTTADARIGAEATVTRDAA